MLRISRKDLKNQIDLLRPLIKYRYCFSDDEERENLDAVGYLLFMISELPEGFNTIEIVESDEE